MQLSTLICKTKTITSDKGMQSKPSHLYITDSLVLSIQLQPKTKFEYLTKFDAFSPVAQIAQ